MTDLSNHNFAPRPAFPSTPFRSIGESRLLRSPLFLAIRDQLPEGVARRVMVTLITDPYFLATKATFMTEDGRAFDVTLEPMTLPNGKWACARVPELFIAHLCVAL
jgi:hypothetical protein